MRLALVAAAFLGLCTVPAAADVVGVSTYGFSGVCADCDGTGSGQLVLQNYTPGDAITTDNFVSFSYDGSNLLPAFTITSAQSTSVSGSMTEPFPSPQDFFVLGNGEIFSSSVGGFWCAGDSCLLDYGFANSWTMAATTPTTVPEPIGLSLLAAPLLGLAAFRSR